MQIRTDSNTFFVFDLDDTLFEEIEYLKSGYRHISAKLRPQVSYDLYETMLERYKEKENVFGWILDEFGDTLHDVDMDWLIKEYREHNPVIELPAHARQFMEGASLLKIPMGLITDGRSISQRNKLAALGIEQFFCDIIISEEFGSQKPDERNYLYFEKKYPGKTFYFFGDNTDKDFIVPSKLGWTTICLKSSGRHIHKQNFDRHPLPDHIINTFDEVELLSAAHAK